MCSSLLQDHNYLRQEGCEMPLINCPECRNSVSDQARSCPQCGYLIRRTEYMQHSVITLAPLKLAAKRNWTLYSETDGKLLMKMIVKHGPRLTDTSAANINTNCKGSPLFQTGRRGRRTPNELRNSCGAEQSQLTTHPSEPSHNFSVELSLIKGSLQFE